MISAMTSLNAVRVSVPLHTYTRVTHKNRIGIEQSKWQRDRLKWHTHREKYKQNLCRNLIFIKQKTVFQTVEGVNSFSFLPNQPHKCSHLKYAHFFYNESTNNNNHENKYSDESRQSEKRNTDSFITCIYQHLLATSEHTQNSIIFFFVKQ